MKSVEVREEDDHLELDLGLSIGGAFRNLSKESEGGIPVNGSDRSSLTLDSDDDDAKINRGEIRRRQAKRKRGDDKRKNTGRGFVFVSDEEGRQRNRPLKREKKEKKKLEGVVSGGDLMMENVDHHPQMEIPSYPYSSLQYVPFLNCYGYAFPCLVSTPYSVACQSFDRSVSDDVGFSNRKSGSSGSSPVCSSSATSDNYNSSSSSPMNRMKKEEPIIIIPSDLKPENERRRLEQMPLVSTAGVRADGTKTMTSGFLYRYSKMEVSILCVCHGKSFSAAEFVKHAGGGEVSHPLRHITVHPCI